MANTNYNLFVDWNNDGDFADADEDVSAYVQRIEWERGRDLANNLTGEYVSGILRVVLKNTSGIFSSFNTGSDIYGNILPSRKIKLSMGGGNFPYTFPFSFNQTQCIVRCCWTDRFKPSNNMHQ